MRLRWGVAVAAWLAAVGSGVPARAQHTEVRAAVTLTGAYNQTVYDSSSSIPALSSLSGPSVSLSPSLVALLDTPRTTNSLTYAFSLTVPFSVGSLVNTAPITYSNRLTYAGHYELDEITSMTFGAGLLAAPVNTLVPSQDPTATPVQATPSGLTYLITVNGNEGFSRQLSERTIFTQSGAFAYGDPINPALVMATTTSGTNSFGLARTFAYDLVGVTLTNQLNYFGPSEDTQRHVTPATSNYINTLALNWTRPFTERFTGTFSAGVTQSLSPDAFTQVQTQPTGSLTLNYTFNYATAALAYTHAAMPNLAAGTVDFNDAASLRFSVPIGVTGFIATGTGGFTHSVPIATSPPVLPSAGTVSSSTSVVNVYLGDAALEYHPERWPTLTVGVRGQITRQVPTDDPQLTNTFTRYTVALNLTYSYPNANAAALRPQLAPLMSASPPSSDVTSTDRFFGAGDLPPVEEAPPAP